MRGILDCKRSDAIIHFGESCGLIISSRIAFDAILSIKRETSSNAISFEVHQSESMKENQS